MTTPAPKPRVKLNKLSRNVLTAGEAVKEGIATHVQKHRAAMQLRHQRMEEAAALNQKPAVKQ